MPPENNNTELKIIFLLKLMPSEVKLELLKRCIKVVKISHPEVVNAFLATDELTKGQKIFH